MNLFDAEAPHEGERFEALARCRNVTIERIVSAAYAEGKTYNQPQDEWVALLRGRATLEISNRQHTLGPGDCLLIAAREKHRVLECSGDAIWLAVHIHPDEVSNSEAPGCSIGIGSLDEIADLEAQIPEFDPPFGREKITRRVAGRKNLCLVARIDGQPVGYKLGYEDTPGRFYSWIGAVTPPHRRQGIAQRLLLRQETWCRDEGYTEIEVQSMNRFRNMLRFLIRNEYDVWSTQMNGTITFRKRLNPES